VTTKDEKVSRDKLTPEEAETRKNQETLEEKQTTDPELHVTV
jgi:hypothetical protein